MGEEVKLFGVWASPFSARVEIALKLKGVDYKFQQEDLSNKSHCLIKYNPIHKKVPALLHKEKPLAESLVIVEYIDEIWDQTYPMLPKDPFERAHARFWARFIDDKFFPTLWKVCYVKEECEKAVEEAIELLKVLENELKDNKYFGGETVGFVDIAGILIAHWLRVIQQVVGVDILNEARFPNLCRWSDDFVSHSVVKEVLPPTDRLSAFYRACLENNP